MTELNTICKPARTYGKYKVEGPSPKSNSKVKKQSKAKPKTRTTTQEQESYCSPNPTDWTLDLAWTTYADRQKRNHRRRRGSA